jgi:hypothetical protein
MIENLLTHHDHTLLAHFVRYKVTSQVRISSHCIIKESIDTHRYLDLCLAIT